MTFESLLLEEAHAMVSDLSSFLEPVEPLPNLQGFLILLFLRLLLLLCFDSQLYHVFRLFVDMRSTAGRQSAFRLA